MDIKIYRQKRRSFMMRPVPGAIEVYIPHQYNENDAQVQDFIAKGLQKLDGKIPEIPPEKTSLQALQQMVDTYTAKLDVKPTRVQFRDMRRKWGSCSSKGTVTLNNRLSWLDADLAEYVVCHELAHLIELNHSKQFWSLMEQHMPDYAERRSRLREVEKTLW
jgi:predicted metal-dependent hydrolase